MKIKSRGKVLTVLLLGFLIRILIGTFTINWDFLKITQLTAKLSVSGLSEIYKDPLSLYPVLTYYTRFLFILISKPFLGHDFLAWSQSGDLSAISNPHIFRYLFILKMPFILIELLTAYIFSLNFDRQLRNKFLLFWMLNPISLYTIAAFTNVDVFPILFIAISMSFFNKNKFNLSSFSLGIAAAYKFFPALILPFLVFKVKGFINRFKIILAFIIPFTLSQIPGIKIADYWKNSLLASSNKIMFTSVLDIGHGRLIMLFIFFYILVFYKYISEDNNKSSFITFFIPFLPIFCLVAFNVQWVYWILPFILYCQFQYGKNITSVILYISFFAIILFSQASLHIGMFSPIEPTLWTLSREHLKILGNDIEFLTNLAYTSFAASIVFIGYKTYQQKNKI